MPTAPPDADPSPDADAIVKLQADHAYITDMLAKLLAIPSPAGYTENISRFVCEELERMGLHAELTRRGAIRATLPGRLQAPKRAIVTHLDTLGAIVTRLKDNGRLAVAPVGTWSSRFAEGARVTIFHDAGHQRGTIMPLKSSGHAYNDEIDTQPVSWDNVEVRVDDFSTSEQDLLDNGFNVGDYVAIDPQPEFRDNGYIVSRHLDNKAGVACMLSAVHQLLEADIVPQMECRLIFTIFEEVGSGASGALHDDIAELVSIDNGVNAPNQNSAEYNVTIAMMDSSGPFDFHLSRWLIALARKHGIRHDRDVFRYYRSDAASAVESGNDLRTALMCFGVDGSHGYERTHLRSLASLTELLMVYLQSGPAVPRDRRAVGGLDGFPTQHQAEPPIPTRRSPDAVLAEDNDEEE
jgi:peptidase M42 family hydrolase